MFRKKHVRLQIFFAIMMLIITSSITTAITPDEDEEEAANLILMTFNKLVLDNLDKNREITNRCALFQEKMLRRELSVVIDHSLDEDIYGGMGFTMNHPKTGLPAIVISPYFLRVHDKNPSIVYSALMHEIVHVYDYFTNYDNFCNSEQNILEKYLYEMDAAYIESLFIKDILQPNKITLTRYEEYLLNSLSKDNLAGFSIAFKAVDMNLVYDLVGLSRGEPTKRKKIKLVAEIGEELLKRFVYPKEELNWEEYCALAQLWTYCQYVPQILVDIESIAKPGFNYQDCKLENYPDVKKNLDRINEIGDLYFKEMLLYRESLLKEYGEL